MLVAPMMPRAQAGGAIPLLLYAQLTGLAQHHFITLVAPAERDDLQAANDLRALGIEVYAVPRVEPHGWARWQRRWRFLNEWTREQYPFRTIWFWHAGIQRVIDQLLAQHAFDLIVAEDNSTGIYRFQSATPRILTEHEVRRPRAIDWHTIATTKSPHALAGELDWQHWRNYQIDVWQRFDVIQVFTPRDADAIKNIAPHLAERVRVNPFGVTLPNLSTPQREEPGTLLFVGNFTHPPNVDAALWLGYDIMPRLRQIAPDVRLQIVGGDAPANVRALASADIQLTGLVPAIEPYLARAAVVLAPIRIGGGQRMKVLQGMAFAKPVVTTPRGADGLSIDGDEPPLALANEAEEFARRTAELLANENARRELGARARAFVERHYSPAAFAARLESVYQTVAAQSIVLTLAMLQV